MKIACFLPRFPVTSQNFVLDQITGLIDRGCEVDLFAHTRGDARHLHADVARYRLLERTRYWAPSRRWQRAAAVLRRPPDLAMLAPALRPRGGRDTRSWIALYSGAPELRERHYDVFHVHFGTVATAPTLLRDRFSPETAVVTTFYGQDVTRFPRERGPNPYQRLFASADRFQALSASMRERLIRLGGPTERIAVHHLGVRCSAIPFHVRKPPADAPIQIVCVARLVQKKGLADAIRAIAILRERKLDVRFDIFGDGPERAHLAAEIVAHHVADRVQLHGAVDPQRALDAIARGQLFLHPSVTARDGDEEGTPTAILEAMASGAPVVSTRHGGIPEQVDDGRTGLLADEGDPVGLADRLETLVREPRRWADLARAARRGVERDFDSDRQNDLLLAEFEQLVSHRQRSHQGFRKRV